MIISDRQILNLMQIANNFKNIIVNIGARQELNDELKYHLNVINAVIDEIDGQQSTELQEHE